MRVWTPVLVVTLALALPASAGPKAEKSEQKDCPHAYGEFDLIVADIEKAATCKEASAIASACAVGGTSDQRLGGAAIRRCERDFLGKLGKAQMRGYEAAQYRCERRFAPKQGTISRSEMAFCLVGVAEKYVKRFSKTGPAQK